MSGPSPMRPGAALLLLAAVLACAAAPAAAHEGCGEEGSGERGAKKKAKAEAAVRASAAAGSEPAAAEDAVPAFASPFGPPYDPVQGEPREPQEAGVGIESVTLVASGRADVEELRGAEDGASTRYFGVLVDLRLGPESTTPRLGADSLFVETASGEKTGAALSCMPTAGVQLSVWHGRDVGLAPWHVALDGRTLYCGGRTARLAVYLRGTGIRVTTKKDGAWSGPLLLLFETARDDFRRVTIAGRTLEIPAPKAEAGAAAAPAPEPGEAAPPPSKTGNEGGPAAD